MLPTSSVTRISMPILSGHSVYEEGVLGSRLPVLLSRVDGDWVLFDVPFEVK